jgi:hypothetical protein
VILERQQFSPTLNQPGAVRRRAGGLAATTGMEGGDRFVGASRGAEVVFNDTGVLTLASQRAIILGRNDEHYVFEGLIVGHADLLVRLAALVSEKFGIAGSWRFGLVVTGLRHATSYVLSHQMWGDREEPYTSNTYERAASASLAEFQQSPDHMVDKLVAALMRSLGSHDHLPSLLK